ncbi:hypothetical protein [Hyphomicrobium methylovorum]|uniref:hypothetical protein n=1 Tax=Hyphomicrobium methylovorum TaxID=84 RepID=UPI0015E707FE|nr:hypothetical protein [Hyphomicrobium methylovorum]
MGYFVSRSLLALSIATISVGLFWLVWIYGNGLRDPRYFDGWVLAGGMSLQVCFHIAIKTESLSPKSARRWQKFHIFLGYLLIAAFLSHTDFSLPDSGFEWMLWAALVLVTLSGIFGTYLAWWLHAKGEIPDRVTFDRIPELRADLARDIQMTVAQIDQDEPALPLPTPPHDAWIADLYTTHLQDFFEGPRNATAHLIGSQHHLKKLTHEIDNLSRYVDARGQEKLAAIKSLVIDKDKLDFARVYLGLTKGWLFIHVPITYSLVVMTILHVLVVYAFSSGAW